MKTRQKNNLFKKYGYKENLYLMDMREDGPQGQAVFMLRFPVTYKHIKSLLRKADFTNYFDWMGQVRELSFEPIMKNIINWLRTKEWGLATNKVNIEIFGFLNVGDTIEVRMWLDKISGLDNIYHISFDWLRYINDRKYERVATSRMIISCVKIISHSKAAISKPPLFVKKYFEQMKPKPKIPTELPTYPQQFKSIQCGRILKDRISNPRFLFEKEYETTLEHSNLIGNVYFANYPKWANAVKDLFLFQSYPFLFDERKIQGEFMTISCNIHHKQEAMPFDKVMVKMYLTQLFNKKVILLFKVFKHQNDNSLLELAAIVQELVFMKQNGSALKPGKIPNIILQDLINDRNA